jgi:O-antigen/teichoic acid export membrane protein
VYPVARINQVVGWTFAVLYMPLAGRFFSRGDPEGMRQAYWHSAAWLCVLTLPIFLLTGPFADPLTTTAFGNQYRGAGTVLAILSTGFYLNMSLGFNTLTLQTFGHLRFTVVVDIISIVVFSAIALMLVPDHGALGAAIAAAVSLVALNLGGQIGIWRMGLGGFDATYVSVYVVVLAAVGVCWLTELALEPTLPFAVLVAAAASFAVLWATRRRLDLMATFPEVSRIPLMRTLFR